MKVIVKDNQILMNIDKMPPKIAKQFATELVELVEKYEIEPVLTKIMEAYFKADEDWEDITDHIIDLLQFFMDNEEHTIDIYEYGLYELLEMADNTDDIREIYRNFLEENGYMLEKFKDNFINKIDEIIHIEKA